MAKRAHIQVSDGINLLPDDLLVCILSFLSLKEAAATSTLCRRWRYLWTFTNKLDFDGSDFFSRLGSRLKHFEHFNFDFLKEMSSVSRNLEESWNYIARVNNILGFHKGSSIEEFRIDFLLYEAHKEYINRWLRIASVKKVERLELNLRWILFDHGERYKQYTFALEFFINFKHLRTLRLRSVNVSGEGLEFLLGSSPLLEELSVYHSLKLGALKIIGSSLALKRLEIINCNLSSLEIHDVNLEFLMYHGGMLQKFVIKNVPHLVQMHLGGKILDRMKDLLLMFSSYLPQLEKLTIDAFRKRVFIQESKMEGRMFYNNVKMSNLHQLIFKYDGVCEFMPQVTYFIRAAPLLQNFVLEVYGGKNKKESQHFVNSVPKELGSYKYHYLKRVEFIGYRGTSPELSLAVHLLKNGGALKQFIVDLRKRDNPQAFENYFWPNSVNGGLLVGYPYREEHKINAVKARVNDQLTKELPSSTLQHVHLNIL